MFFSALATDDKNPNLVELRFCQTYQMPIFCLTKNHVSWVRHPPPIFWYHCVPWSPESSRCCRCARGSPALVAAPPAGRHRLPLGTWVGVIFGREFPGSFKLLWFFKGGSRSKMFETDCLKWFLTSDFWKKAVGFWTGHMSPEPSKMLKWMFNAQLSRLLLSYGNGRRIKDESTRMMSQSEIPAQEQQG